MPAMIRVVLTCADTVDSGWTVLALMIVVDSPMSVRSDVGTGTAVDGGR